MTAGLKCWAHNPALWELLVPNLRRDLRRLAPALVLHNAPPIFSKTSFRALPPTANAMFTCAGLAH